jgi:threonine 3-dehydrogenase
MRAFRKNQRAPGGELEEIPEPVPREDEVLIAVRASSICGTDLHLWEWNEWAQARVQHLPMTLGHEVAGEVVKVGSRVRGLAVGDSVSAETHIADGICRQCRTGRMHVCENVRVLGVDVDGVFAEYAVLPQMNAWRNDPALDPALAAMQEPLGNAVHSLLPEDCVEDLAGKHVLVTGCGPIGLLTIAVAKSFGAESVLATEVNPVRSTLAKRMGADAVFDPTKEGRGLATTIRNATDGHGVDVATEMSGHPASLNLVFEALSPGGRVSLLGLFSRPASLDIDNAIIFRSAKVYGIYGRRMFETWYTVKGLLSRPAFREAMGRIITHRLPIAELPKAMELLQSGQAAKIALEARW